MEVVLKFEAPDDWNPMIEPCCWVHCPFAVLTKLGHVCRAKEIYDKRREIVCPIITKINKSGT